MLAIAVTLVILALSLFGGAFIYSTDHPSDEFAPVVGVGAIGLFLLSLGVLLGIWLG